jgi:hypothetical protein
VAVNSAATTHVNAVAPGPILSGRVTEQPPEVHERIGQAVPLGRMATRLRWLRPSPGWRHPRRRTSPEPVLEVSGGKGAGGA